MRTLSVLPLVFLAGCELLDLGDDSDPTTDPESTDSPTAPPTTDTEPPPATTTPPTTPPPESDWWASAHPCFGNRTDAMWVDDRDNVWVGCGSTTEGTGLFHSADGGRSWAAPSTTPNNWLSEFRVSSIQRADDGLLYVAGINTVGAERVVALDTTVTPAPVSAVFDAGSQVWNSFHVGTFRRNADGLSVAESLTGTSMAVRFDDADAFEDGYGWWTSGSSYQILDLVLHDDEFYGCGSTIIEPPHVFLPPRDGQDPALGFRLEPVQLVSGIAEFDGELWGLDADDGGIVAAGVDQDHDVGVVFVSGDDPYDAQQWSMLDVSTLVGDEPTWMRGACRSGDTIVAVGEYSMRGDGLVLHSEDGGATWADVTPLDLDVPSVHRCHVFDDGDYVLTGAEGFFGTFDPK